MALVAENYMQQLRRLHKLLNRFHLLKNCVELTSFGNDMVFILLNGNVTLSSRGCHINITRDKSAQDDRSLSPGHVDVITLSYLAIRQC